MNARNDGKQLEEIIGFIEALRLPEGWRVEPRKLVCGKSGGAAAELDIVITGQVGTIDFSWLIECRDRAKKAPASWIEQLAARKARFNFSRVTAVSTSGFSAAAVDVAEQFCIDLREFKKLSPKEFESWPELTGLVHRADFVVLHSVAIGFESFSSPSIEREVFDLVQKLEGNAVLKSASTGERVSLHQIFNKITDRHPEILSGIEVNGSEFPVRFKVDFASGNSHLLETNLGDFPVAVIVFEGSVRRQEGLKSLLLAGEYSRVQDGSSIARIRTFESQNLFGVMFNTELHDNPLDGSTMVVVRANKGAD